MTGTTLTPRLPLILAAIFFAAATLSTTPAFAAKGGKGGGKPGKDTTPPDVTISSPSGGESFQTPSIAVTGTVTDNVAVDSAELTVNAAPPVPLALSLDGSFTAPATLQPGSNTITVDATDTSGRSAAASVTVTLLESSPAVTITSPSDGDVIHSSHVDIHGTFQDPVTSLRYIPGLNVVPGSFIIRNRELLEGQSNEITVTGLDDAGNEYTTTIHVSSSSSSKPLTLTADTAGGELPLTVNFTLTNNTLETVTSCEVDFYGNGGYAGTPDCLGGFSHTYEHQEFSTPSVRVTTAEGHHFTAFTVVSPYAPAELLASIPAADPMDIEVDSEGRLYILERAASRVVVTDADGTVLATVGGPGTGDGFFTEPTGIGVDHSGRLFVADAATDKVQVFSPSFQHAATWGRAGSRRGGLNDVRGIDAQYDGKLLLADAANGRVDVYRPDGYFENDRGKGLMTAPRDVVWTGGGRFAASDSGSGEVNIWSPGSVNPYTWKNPLPALGAPAGLEYDTKNGALLIADEGMNRVTMVVAYDEMGVFIRHIDALAGDTLGLSRPKAVARVKHPVDTIYYIADSGNNRVVKVKLPADGGPTPMTTWAGVRDALTAGDIEGALAHFSLRSQDAYRDLFSTAGDQLPVIVGDMGEIYPLRENGHQAVYGVLRYDDGKPFLFEVVFVRDGGGEWKILRW
jgi:sugar lactone lactonase YvrE